MRARHGASRTGGRRQEEKNEHGWFVRAAMDAVHRGGGVVLGRDDVVVHGRPGERERVGEVMCEAAVERVGRGSEGAVAQPGSTHHGGVEPVARRVGNGES